MNRVMSLRGKPALPQDYKIPKINRDSENKDTKGRNKSSNKSMKTVSVEAEVHNKSEKKVSFEEQLNSAYEAYSLPTSQDSNATLPTSQDSNATGEFNIEEVTRQTRKSKKITYKEVSENEMTSSQSDAEAAIFQISKLTRGLRV